MFQVVSLLLKFISILLTSKNNNAYINTRIHYSVLHKHRIINGCFFYVTLQGPFLKHLKFIGAPPPQAYRE